MSVDDIELTPFQDLNDEEKFTVLKWRNNENVTTWMYSSSTISKDKHFKFIESLKEDKFNQYFLVQSNGQKIGVIYFNKINTKSAYLGLYSNPTLNIVGLGKTLIEISIKYAFENLKIITLKLELFNKNLKAKALYNKFNFQKIDMKVVNNKEVICMELKNENR